MRTNEKTTLPNRALARTRSAATDSFKGWGARGGAGRPGRATRTGLVDLIERSESSETLFGDSKRQEGRQQPLERPKGVYLKTKQPPGIGLARRPGRN